MKWHSTIVVLSSVWGMLGQQSVTFLSDEWYAACDEPVINVSSLFRDLARFGRNIVAPEMVAVIAPFIPPFGLSYMVDTRVRKKFYCAQHHKNMRACSRSLIDTSELLVGLSIGTLCSCSFAVKSKRLQRTAQLYAITLPITWALKSVIKKIPWCGNVRPRSEAYERHKVYYGGFPSGHMLEMVYATVFFGLSMGPGFGIPLGIATGVVATTFVKHRHTIPQLIAGAAIGTVFGFAGYWAVTQVEDRDRAQWSVRSDFSNRQVGLCAEYRF